MSAVQIGVIGLWMLALLFTLYVASGILLPIVMALFLAVILYPLVRWQRRLGIPEGIGAAVTLLILLGTIAIGAYFLSGPAMDWLNRGPEIIDELRRKTWSLRQAVEGARETAQEVAEITEPGTDETETVVVEDTTFAAQVFSITWTTAANVAVTLFIMFFLLALGRSTVTRVIEAIPSPQRQDYARHLLSRLKAQVADYLQTITLINIAFGLVAGVAFALVGLPNAVLWGVLVFFMGFIPYLGPLVMLAIITVVSLLTFDSWPRILLPIGIYGLLELIEGQFSTPWIVGRRLTLNPIAVFVFILIWGTLWGVLGAVLAVPILASIKILCDTRPGLAPISALLGADQDADRRHRHSDGSDDHGPRVPGAERLPARNPGPQSALTERRHREG